MILKPKLCIMLPFMAIFTIAYGQQKKIDSLESLLKRQPKSDKNTVNILNRLAYHFIGNDEHKLKLYVSEALPLATKLNYLKGEARTNAIMGFQYTADNADPRGLDYLNKACNIYKSINDKLGWSDVLSNIGMYYSAIKDYKTALDYDFKALEAVNGLKASVVNVIDFENIGDDFEKIQNYENAKEYYIKSNILAEQTGDKSLLPVSYLSLASIYFKEKKYPTALSYCNKVKQLQKQSNDVNAEEIADLNLLEAQIYYDKKDYRDAEESLDRGASITNKTQVAESRMLVYHVKYMLDSVMHRPYEALKYSYLYHQLNDNTTNVNKNQVSAVYNFNVKLQKNADENLRLRIVEEKNRAIINKQHIILAISFCGLFMFLCGLIYLKRSYNQIRIKNKIIEEQNNSLENINKVKDKLFSVISHDLRGPVAQVIGLINLWETGDMDNKEILTVTPVIKTGIVNTLDLLDTLMIWSTNQSKDNKFNALEFELYDLIKQNIKDMDNQITKKELVIRNKIARETRLHADYDMIKIVLRNLISNAVKFTPNRGIISIDSYTEKEQIVIVVEDTGVGMSEADKLKVFSFSTHTTLGTANEKGTGIGLKICREFMELNNGKIWVESKKCTGSKFFVSIPFVNKIMADGIIN